MQKEDWEKVDRLAKRALDLSSEKRNEFFDGLNTNDRGVRREVESMVNMALGVKGDFMEQPVLECVPSLRRELTSSEEVPREIDQYRLLECIGKGGMGEVYLAEQTYPIRRRLALKLIRAELINKDMIARFSSEHQALAYMDHPYIAHIHNADVSSEGIPYFTMEYLPGLPITGHVRRHDLSLEERLNLFVKVCEGVQHAHHKGIIHRDLKPSNILIVERDDQPVPKIIDFGIAKAVNGQSLSAMTLYTERGVLIGTPCYMSPEQADISCFDVDTRTDIYALGAILYEVLCGIPPFDPSRLQEASLIELLDIICHEDPPTPSTRLRVKQAAERKTGDYDGDQTLARRLNGDLDNIVMKAMEKDRSRRYASAGELANDLRCFLMNEPVSASSPSTIYKVMKFVRRKPATVLAVCFGLLSLLLLCVMAIYWGHRSSQQSEQDKESREVVENVLESFFDAADPFRGGDPNISVKDSLFDARIRLNQKFPPGSKMRGQVMLVLARTFLNLGFYEQGAEIISGVVNDPEFKNGHPDQMDALPVMAEAFYHMREYDEAEAFILEAFETYPDLKPRNKLQLKRWFANSQKKRGKIRHALALYHEIVKAYDETDETDIEGLALTLCSQADAYDEAQDSKEANKLYEKAISLVENREKLEDITLQITNNYVNFLVSEGRYEPASQIISKINDSYEHKFGREHPITLYARHNVGRLEFLRGNYKSSYEILKEVYQLRLNSLGERNERTQQSRELQALSLGNLGNHGEAIKMLESVHNMFTELQGANGESTITTTNNLIHHYKMNCDFSKAERLAIEVIDIAINEFGMENTTTLNAQCNLAEVLIQTERYEQASDLLENILVDAARTRSEDDLDIAYYKGQYGLSLKGLGRDQEARFYLEDAFQVLSEAESSEANLFGKALVEGGPSSPKPDSSLPIM